MKKHLLGVGGMLLLAIGFSVISWTSPIKPKFEVKTITEDILYQNYVSTKYKNIGLEQAGLSATVFEKALTGYYNLKNTGKTAHGKSILTIADFDQNSTRKRLWIIDLERDSLLLHTWVAHGEKSGGDLPTRFSDTNDSNESSLGFYLTAEIYRGKHGRSLRLDGMDEGYNANARKRAIVVHGAPYVSQETINELGRLGRSHGCPAVPAELSNQVINTIAGKTVIFINGTRQHYNSKYLDTHLAADMVLAQRDRTDSLEKDSLSGRI